MTDDEIQRSLAELHPASAGWALSCCRWDREEAEEVLQVAYLKILDGRARFGGRSSFRTWLFGVIRRTAAEQRRGRTRRPVRAGLLGVRPLALAAAFALAALGVWLGVRAREPRHPAVPPLAEWRSPTDFLLATPGRDLLAAPAAWDRSVLDLREVPLTSQPERRFPS